jgi:CRP-like cAMP-binding protein
MFDSERQRLNFLLAALPQDEINAWQSELQDVHLIAGQVLYESGGCMTHVFFPTTAVISLMHILEDGGSTEIAMTGHEGMVGISVFMGGESTLSRGVVQRAGHGYKLRTPFIKQAFHRSPAVMHLMLRYTQAIITQMSQIAVCNRHHSILQQLSRWLLLNLDRVDEGELIVTHESISQALGVRREGITKAAGSLQEEGLIRYTRGHLSVQSRAGLEAHACECYGVIKHEYDRLLPQLTAT